jgi:MFS family permease
MLALGTLLAGGGYALAGMSLGLPLLAIGLVVGGLGSATQHPIGSTLVADAFAGRSKREALGTYNFAGDIGKMAFPAAISLLLMVAPWRWAAFALAGAGLAVGGALLLMSPRRQLSDPGPAVALPDTADLPGGSIWTGPFANLMAIGVFDSATRMGFMTFLPFLLAAKGAATASAGLALSLVFAGGACGKLAFGFLGARLGVTQTVIATKAATAVLVLAVLALPLLGVLAALPLLGVMLNGTSSVLYGSVPDCCTPEHQPRAFGVFYTATIGAGAIAPALFGIASDQLGLMPMMAVLAGFALLTLPLAWMLPASLRA